ncbi:hypothetical protein BU14_0116s0014 [Porphyra umbilicalis]|uniref:Uncharacterized protein n=1 Tax=Porphyra umbilicalis TaxID=2786 RepID=A0A1X6PBH1_PORUM|nr:hypothetical protein BU14_0116s0014 [Porphyra umbilicalis]|eukprot:OSX78194.1 hypothetical protein BU14_0116s0014 [Porphyra umbilicalis]
MRDRHRRPPRHVGHLPGAPPPRQYDWVQRALNLTVTGVALTPAHAYILTADAARAADPLRAYSPTAHVTALATAAYMVVDGVLGALVFGDARVPGGGRPRGEGGVGSVGAAPPPTAAAGGGGRRAPTAAAAAAATAATAAAVRRRRRLADVAVVVAVAASSFGVPAWYVWRLGVADGGGVRAVLGTARPVCWLGGVAVLAPHAGVLAVQVRRMVRGWGGGGGEAGGEAPINDPRQG